MLQLFQVLSFAVFYQQILQSLAMNPTAPQELRDMAEAKLADPDGPTLLSVPQEIRDIIYKYVYAPGTIRLKHRLKARPSECYCLPPRLGAVCRQLRSETQNHSSKGHNDWYHREEVRQNLARQLCPDISSLQTAYRVIVDTPCHAVYGQAVICVKFNLSWYYSCDRYTIRISGRKKHKMRPQHLVVHKSSVLRPDTPDTYFRGKSRRSIALLAAEALMRLPVSSCHHMWYAAAPWEQVELAILSLCGSTTEMLQVLNDIGSQLRQPYLLALPPWLLNHDFRYFRHPTIARA